MIQRTIITCLFILSILSNQAQTGKWFNSDQYLSSNLVNQIYQDREGFIWISTRNGLDSYDGYRFKIYKHKEGYPNSLFGNYVNCVAQTHNGTFFIGMYNGIQTFDGHQFREITTLDRSGKQTQCYVTSIIQRRNGAILISTSGHGLMRLNHQGIFTPVYPSQSKLRNTYRILEDNDRRLWIVTEKQGVFAEYGGKMRSYPIPLAAQNSLTDICQDALGNVYISCENGGIYKYERAQDALVQIPVTAHLPVTSVCVTHDRKLMLGCNGNGLSVYDLNTRQLSYNPYYSPLIHLDKSKIYSIIEDKSHNIWLGMLQKGVFMVPPGKTGFKYDGFKTSCDNPIGATWISSIIRTHDGHLWIGTDQDGLYIKNKQRQLEKHLVPSSASSSVPKTILCMEEDGKGRVWVGSYIQGFGWIDPHSLVYHPISFNKPYANNVYALATDKTHTLWIGTMGDGVKKMDLNTGKITEYHLHGHAETDRQANSLPNDFIKCLCLSHDHRRLYVGSSIGVCCLDIHSNNWTSVFKSNLLLNGKSPTCIREDNKNNLWIAMLDGLYQVNLRTLTVKRYTTRNGLSDNSLTAVETDHHGNLWISSNHGLSKLNTNTGKITSYYAEDGINSNEFADNAMLCDDEGNIVIGGANGIVWFQPDEIKHTPHQLLVHLTDLTIEGESIYKEMKSGMYTVTDTSTIDSHRFDLCCNDNTFALNLSTLTFNNQDNTIYSYCINEGSWITLQPGENIITFSKLPPGTYHFQVKAINGKDVSRPLIFTIKIHSPWYAMWWACIVYLLMAAGLICAIIIESKKRRYKELRLQEHIHAEQLGEAKLRSFINISHEIRTPMTLILSPLLSLIHHDKDAERQSYYHTIQRNANRIINLINQLMDIRKIDQGKMVMHMQETDLIQFIEEVNALFAIQAKNTNIHYLFIHSDDHLSVWIDRNNFDKVLMNVISNAFKYTRSGGEIQIEATRDAQSAIIIISDDGESIPEDNLERIFERFYQSYSSNANTHRNGTGVGLDLTRSLVELHHGTIKAENLKDKKGCRFIISIPLGCQHLTTEEMASATETVQGSTTENLAEDTLYQEIEQQPALPKTEKRPLIFIVDDDDEIRNYLLQEFGKIYNVAGFPNGTDALTATLTQSPALVISDVMMPQMNGYELCDKIKTNINTNSIPVILLTAKTMDEDHLTGIESGADAYLEKPFNLEILLRVTSNLLKSRNILKNKYEGKEDLNEQIETVSLQSADEKLMNKMIEIINQNIDNSDLNVNMISQKIGISRVHLYRKTKELTNQTPHELIRNIRLKQAANLLSKQHYNITEVMYACGFNSSAFFSSTFKKFYGVSPTEYMKECKEKKE